MTEIVKESDTMERECPICTPGPTSLEAYELVHGDKEDTTSKEARLDSLFQDFRKRIDGLKPAYMLSTAYCGNCHFVMDRSGPDHKIARCVNPHCIAQGIETSAWSPCA